jgi:hypothetical protein
MDQRRDIFNLNSFRPRYAAVKSHSSLLHHVSELCWFRGYNFATYMFPVFLYARQAMRFIE